MKTPPTEALAALEKATVTDPVIAGTARNAGNASTAGNASNAGNVGNVGTTSTIKKFTIRIDAELLGRVRAAYLREVALRGEYESLSAWTARQLEDVVEHHEAVHNHGAPYTPLDSGVIPQGRIQ
ncbi:hypothetical protein ACU21_01480 [Actinobaculum suis]|uniref:hypothetical protein n=1 Tax=Actinobaculum suis TaxID=1657 RepID=UPI00066FDAC9|nr:hypothetical protein [Actinobaculum suis]KMY22779.1 hypothetical protein ACU19_07910 [Actinobaculum suis]OCA93145.1 hypothetical protein ACU21_01480 [Actinobaculum suis]